jgi:murein DD-endopeptidase MepM/ murein hydrolase activator NlpD
MDSRVLTAAVACGLLALAGCGWMEWPPPKSRAWDGRLPTLSAPPVSIGAGESVVVERGDTVWGLSRRHGVSMRAIIDANGLRPPFQLSVGQRLAIPGRAAAEPQRGLAPPPPPSPVARVEAVELPPPAAGAGPSTPPPAASAPPPPAPMFARVPEPIAASAPPPASGRGFAWPLKGRVVSAFGDKAKGMRNDGINIQAPRGAPVLAAENGVVSYAGNELRGFGNLVLVKHADGWISAYAHADELLVRRGEEVRKGQPIARVGSSGNVPEPQLHFELRLGKQAVDPLTQLPPLGT